MRAWRCFSFGFFEEPWNFLETLYSDGKGFATHRATYAFAILFQSLLAMPLWDRAFPD